MIMRRGLTALVTTVAAIMLATGVPGVAGAASSWTVQQVPLPGGDGAELTGVSCPTVTTCFAVGGFAGTSSTNAPVVEEWNGSTWAPQTLPQPPGLTAGEVTAISCPSPTACTAVGNALGFEGHSVALVEQWNGSTWTDTPLPKLGGQRGGALTEVSCFSSASCIALTRNTVKVAGIPVPVAERWNGTTWKAHVTAPLPPGTTFGVLYGLSCPSATSCLAAGVTDLGPLTEHWNGSTWTIQSTTGGGGDAISCFSATNCTSVGGGGTTAGNILPVAEHWNGHTWRRMPAPLPSGGTNGILYGVSCPSATWCTAAGWWNKGSSNGRHNALAEVWNGTAWRPQMTAQPASRKTFLAISCAAAQTCTAVGFAQVLGQPIRQPLAEHE